jgi:N-acetylglucosaminyldiphosphoundecaprenol N-acetyl-beta-D-mannosaminyltransferase
LGVFVLLNSRAVMASDLSSNWPLKKDLFGVGVSATTYGNAVDSVIRAAAEGRGGVATFLAVHGIVNAVMDPEYRERVNRCQIVAPDGQPVRWALNFFQNTHLHERVYGPEIMRWVCQRCADEGLSVFLCGSTPQVLALLATRLLEMFPHLKIAGVESPPFRPMTEAENDALCERINLARPGVVFVGLGVPRQETFADSNRNKIHAVQLCVGAAFDFLAGNKKVAPPFMQRRGLEWLFRLCQEPARLWKRYLVTNTVFVGLVVLNALKLPFHRREVPQGVGAS